MPETEQERGEKMLYGDYEHVLAKERMQSAIREREHDRLVKQLRLASRSPRGGLIARSVALITSLFSSSKYVEEEFSELRV